MIKISLGNKVISIDENSFLSDLLTKNGYTDVHFAVALNRQFVPRSYYTTTKLNEGDVIDIITPMQGG